VRLRLPIRGGNSASLPDAPRPALSMPWRHASWCAVDVELTGLNPRKDHIIAIGAVPIEQGRVILGRALYTLVRTSRPSELGAILTHKLRSADLEGAPPIDEALELLAGVLAGSAAVFHCAAIEQGFLGPLFSARRARLPDAADTQVLARLWLLQRGQPAPAGLPLTRVARMLGQDTEITHHALGDALMTAQVFIALATHLESREPQSVGRLVKAQDHFRGARRFGPI
jgi:DNA polymerase III subunit epsilon